MQDQIKIETVSLVSVVVLTYNDKKYLEDLLRSIKNQIVSSEVEIVVVDRGSTDTTLDIAKSYECKIESVSPVEYTAGKAFNRGCEVSLGKIIAFIGGRCLPENTHWLNNLITPLLQQDMEFVCGPHVPTETCKFSRKRSMHQLYALDAKKDKKKLFYNNENTALLRSVWMENRFNESLLALEGMELVYRLTRENDKAVAFSKDAKVLHSIDEAWSSIREQYFWEALALREIMPQVHIKMPDTVRYFISSVLLDFGVALQERKFLDNVSEIVMYRLMQYWGTYRGNRVHGTISHQMKEKYFYPK